MRNMELQQCIVGMIYTNCYFVKNKETKELLIVDPGAEPDKINRMVDRMEGTPIAILLTHGHYDHILAAEELRTKYKIPIYGALAEKELFEDPSMNMSGTQNCSIVCDKFVEDGDMLSLAGFDIQVISTPGHTAGSVCYYFEQEHLLLSGDTLFCQSVGRSDLPTGSTSQLMDSLHHLLDVLPEDVDVLPGHDTATTISHEKRYNPFV